MKILILMFSLNTFAGLSLSSGSYNYSFESKTKKSVRKKSRNRTSKVDKLLSELSSRDKQIYELLLNNQKNMNVSSSENKVRPLTRIRGILQNSVLATNRKQSKMIIKLVENEYFEEAKVRCIGVSGGKRILAKCNLIIDSTKDYEIEGELWDTDGADGIVSDEYYDGSEKEFLTSSVASFFQGVLQASKDTFVTPYGRFAQKSNKNSALSGLESIASNVNSKIKESGEENIQVSLLNSGREVILYFDKEVKI